ncbi:MAG TPA: translation initiation factor IF-2 [Candidatus Mcinerneyibacteriales bacterium]|nr:translation initiation factor IF-2 [Candidatus Mcinerneyibacteriales bacterium]HPE20708.1 translation initiation factor IF-2 [Candidatus Mcinerneyibacteriales bacterium]HPJ70019.1 translation initiation factor IF-2 [Candidatus Mcinerneyibacteriales bacterium]HPQ89020.1 translation initiation factor IF-2 [Candidatus Mcinerneyibacteriales bacterium]
MDEKKRVFELAKEIGVPSSDLVDFFINEGVEIKNHMSYVGPYEIRTAKEHYGIEIEEDKDKMPQARLRRRARPKRGRGEAPEKSGEKEEAGEEKAKAGKTAEPSEEAKEKADKKEESKKELPSEKKPAEKTPVQPVSEERSAAPQAEETAAPVEGDAESAPAKKVKEKETEEELERGRGKKAKKFEPPKGVPKRTKARKAKKTKEEREWEEHLKFLEEEKAQQEEARRKAAEKEASRKISWKEIMESKNIVDNKKKKEKKSEKEETKEKLYLMKGITYRDFAENLGLSAKQLVKILEKEGISVEDIESSIEEDYAHLLAEEFGKELELIRHYGDDILIKEYKAAPARNEVSRPPVVTIMGHVDHGKTSILDYIRHSRIAAGEFGGITQHIGAYSVSTPKGEITFIDTPGHEAFTAMRARGANITDIVVLVVAADDGVMPQTVEAINHAKAAGVPLIVAMNKMDLPGANPDKVKQELIKYEVMPEEWGGQNLFAYCSAKTGEGIDNLLEMILLQAEMMDLKTRIDVPARGVVVESNMEKGKGNVATILVKEGILSVGEAFVVGATYGRVRTMIDDKGKRIKSVKPGRAVEITGLDNLPGAGDEFAVLSSDKTARIIAEKRAYYEKRKGQLLEKQDAVSLEDLFARMNEQEKAELTLIIKGDTQGTVEAIIQSIQNIDVEEVDVKILHTGVGIVVESDVNLAMTAKAIIVAFNVRTDTGARRMAEDNNVEIRNYNIIYKLIEDLLKAVEGLLEPESVEAYRGTAEVRQVFQVPKVGSVAGCYVKDGKILRNGIAKLVRDGQYIWEGKLDSLQRFKDSVKEVAEGYECGIGLAGYNDIKDGDLIEVYEIEEHQRTL